MTEKLYWADGAATTFDARILGVGEHQGKPVVRLDRSLFYPEGGGQLGDRGAIQVGAHTFEVIDTQIDDGGTIEHVVAAAGPELLAGTLVRGSIDGARRRDHTAQHTAQHALSRALEDVAKGETVSARLGKATCTIDVARPGIPDSDLHRAEDLVNALIASDVVVRTLYPKAGELASLPLRKQPKVTTDVIRIIDIDGFDMTPCGGTHCARTGQIGQARIVGLEKYKGMLRITFHAGTRALVDARAKHDALATLGADLTCGIADVHAAVTKLRGEIKETRVQLELARTELAELVARTTPRSGAIVAVARPNNDVGFLRVLAGKLATDNAIAICTTKDAGGELVFVVQRGPESTFDCGAFVKAVTSAHSGRGGGRPERAEGRATLDHDQLVDSASGLTSSSLR